MNTAMPFHGSVSRSLSSIPAIGVSAYQRTLPVLLVPLAGFSSPVSAFPGETLLLDTEVPFIWVLVLALSTAVFAFAWIVARSKIRTALDAGAAQATDLQAENAKLFRQVQSRVHELMTRDKLLEEAKLEAEQMREEHCDFLSITGHRMRKPLETLVSTMNLLSRGTDGEVRQLAEAALGQCRQLRSNIEDIQRTGQMSGQVVPAAATRDSAQRELEVLLIENDTHPSLRTRLEAHGHRVRRETNGVDGADAALRGKFDLVLIDVRLPLIDGVETARKIRGDFGNKDLLIFGMLPDLRKGDKERYMERGLSGILPLPASDPQLLQLLSWVEQKTRETAPAAKPARAAKMLNPTTLERQRDTLGHLAFAELLGERLANMPKKITSFTSSLTGRHWLDAQHQAQAIAAEAESVGLEVVASRLKALSARLSIDSERDYCRHQRTEILGLMRTSIQQLKSWREKNVHTEWALR
ncbi:response regulator [uncultured Microbulbifer sp.]|uniref:response regulator n=1 Tax=uncultured Microbulbifer sp. TaxID=348147 RepID=UPI00260C0A1A|nr:hybrid sensor histidine kinase/response regulator [uncultured Microbulbifer sp.]